MVLNSQNIERAVVIGEISFEDLLSDNEGLLEAPLNMPTFIRYCKDNFVDESILFYNEVTSLKRSAGRSRDQFQAHVAFISSTFVEENAKSEINISANQRQKTVASVKKYLNSDRKDFFVPGLACFEEAIDEVVHLMKTDVWPRFVQYATLRKRIGLSREIALWWRQKDLTWSDFWSFPSPVNVLESRLNNFCSALLIALSVFLTYKYDFYYLDCYIVYGFLIRTLSGPRLDPQAFVVLFVLRPLVEDKLRLGVSSFFPGAPFRFAQFVGLVFGITGTTLHVLDLWWPSVFVWGAFFFAAALAASTGLCLACFFFGIAGNCGLLPSSVAAANQVKFVAACAPTKA